MESSLEVPGKTGITDPRMTSPTTDRQTVLSEHTADEKQLGRKIEGTIGRIFTGFIKNSEPPATDVVLWLFGASNLG
jgi:hypothetical protein